MLGQKHSYLFKIKKIKIDSFFIWNMVIGKEGSGALFWVERGKESVKLVCHFWMIPKLHVIPYINEVNVSTTTHIS